MSRRNALAARTRPFGGWAAASLVVFASLAAVPLARAHIEIIPNQVQPGYAILQLFLYHGCGSAPTERLTLRIPEDVGVVRPRVKEGWELTTVSTEYEEPFDVYGEVFRRGFTAVTWSGGSVPSAYMDSFALSVYFRDVSGQAVQFTTEQWCAGRDRPEVATHDVLVRAFDSLPATEDEPEPAAAPEPEAGADEPTVEPAAPDRVPLVLSASAAVLSLIALMVAFRRRN